MPPKVLMMVDILKHEGKPAFVIMPYDEYQAMIEKLEDLEDSDAIREFRAALRRGEEELIPAEVVDRLLTDNTVKVWREYRGMSQKALSEKTGISEAMISQIESGKKQGSLKTNAKIAQALNLTVDDIIE
ncbi:helix-turn-helix domain-containing protein [Endozoicomonas sp. ONNA2]|uniref:helix-turn-helix domain-containing protein n=1 Tax=Endozoicomonas sp. ONNA2 TaxID=2828741 RepID=UPI002148DB37|nr:helix-turn-helix domain-containing protein [Endozoicomonas sp. ONNA2]